MESSYALFPETLLTSATRTGMEGGKHPCNKEGRELFELGGLVKEEEFIVQVNWTLLNRLPVFNLIVLY